MYLLKRGILRDLAGQLCPSCKKGVCSELRSDRGRLHFRCGLKKCNKRLPLLEGHPVFMREADLMAQVPVVFASLVGVKQGQLGLLVGAGEHSIRESLARLRQVQKWDVLQTQKQVKFGDDHKHWVQVESDEVSLRSRPIGGQKICSATW